MTPSLRCQISLFLSTPPIVSFSGEKKRLGCLLDRRREVPAFRQYKVESSSKSRRRLNLLSKMDLLSQRGNKLSFARAVLYGLL